MRSFEWFSRKRIPLKGYVVITLRSVYVAWVVHSVVNIDLPLWNFPLMLWGRKRTIRNYYRLVPHFHKDIELENGIMCTVQWT